MILQYDIPEPSVSVVTSTGPLPMIELAPPAEPASATPALYSCSIVGVALSNGDVIKMPLSIYVCTESDGVHAENEELTLFGCGETVSEAINDLIEALACTWEGLKDRSDEELSEDAIVLRDKIAWYLGGPGDSQDD